jgi:hypothetical protein
MRKGRALFVGAAIIAHSIYHGQPHIKITPRLLIEYREDESPG